MTSLSARGNLPKVDELYPVGIVIATEVSITYSLTIRSSETKYVIHWKIFSAYESTSVLSSRSLLSLHAHFVGISVWQPDGHLQ